jgi:hypothetical protein
MPWPRCGCRTYSSLRNSDWVKPAAGQRKKYEAIRPPDRCLWRGARARPGWFRNSRAWISVTRSSRGRELAHAVAPIHVLEDFGKAYFSHAPRTAPRINVARPNPTVLSQAPRVARTSSSTLALRAFG